MTNNHYREECLFVRSDRDIIPYPIYVGDVLHAPSKQIATHTHGHYEISLFLSGEVDVNIGEKKYHLQPGDVLMTKPGDIHSFASRKDEDWSFYYFGINKIAPEDLAFAFMKTRHRQFTDCSNMKPLFAQLYSELKQPGFGVQHVVSALTTNILYLLGRKIAGTAKDRQAYCDVAGGARAYIDAHAHHGITTKEIARECCLSESRLSHLFSQKTGMTLSGYITHVLMNSAIRMLEDKNNSISGIASHLGYPSPQYFSRVFKKFWGYSPRECRLSLKKMHGEFSLPPK